ncbi:BppU family phage baseplate upper protein [Listeria booriae]|uniref:BppU family phage baseplate upper protein n=1 Tax=Listeria booriae TaxID=1552123 RepID=UPI0016276417|nr:BppU family phage baseplate upper protein [Listeria booriae]MBC1290490.1 BppU family phage baseplate upper protein [Listeria booriae]
MALRNIPITVDLNRAVRSNQEIWGRVGDNGLMTLNVSVIDTSDSTKKVVDLTGLTIYFTLVYPDGTYFRDSLNITNRDDKLGTFDYTLTANCFAQAGAFDCHFRIEKGTTTKLRSGTRDFTLTIEADGLQDNIAMPDFASDIDQFNADIQAAIAESQAQLNDALADLATASANVDTAIVKADAVVASINANQVVKITDAANWQKAKLTNDAGVAKAPPDVTSLAEITEQGSFYINSTAAAKLTDAPLTGGFRLENNRLISGVGIEQHARYFSTTNASALRHFFRYVGASVTAWREYETTTGSQAKADAAQANAIQFVNTKFTDSGWLPLPLKTGFTAGSSTPQYRKIGTLVMYRGLVIRTSGGTGVFATAPAGYRTSDAYLEGFVVGQQSSAAGASGLVYVKPTGDVELVAATNATGIWLSGISYYTD